MLVQGYTFSTRHGVRYVVAHDLPAVKYNGPYRGTHTTYRWGRTGWVAVSTKSSGTVSAAVAQKKYSGLVGLNWR